MSLECATSSGASLHSHRAGVDDLDASRTGNTTTYLHLSAHRGYATTITTTSGVLDWRLGEASGTSAADSKGTNTATSNANPTLGSLGAIVADTNTAATFDGSAWSQACAVRTAHLYPTRSPVLAPWSCALSPRASGSEFTAVRPNPGNPAVDENSTA